MKLKKQTCSNCFYGKFIEDNPAYNVVICRRYPPTVTEVKDNNVRSNSPILDSNWWCGEYRSRSDGYVLSHDVTSHTKSHKGVKK